MTYYQQITQECDHKKRRVKHDVDCQVLCIEEVSPRATGVVPVLNINDLDRARLDDDEDSIDDSKKSEVRDEHGCFPAASALFP